MNNCIKVIRVSCLKVLYLALACCLPLQAAQPAEQKKEPTAREKQIKYAPAALKPALEKQQLSKPKPEDATKTPEELEKARIEAEEKNREKQKTYAPAFLKDLLKEQKLPPTRK